MLDAEKKLKRQRAQVIRIKINFESRPSANKTYIDEQIVNYCTLLCRLNIKMMQFNTIIS